MKYFILFLLALFLALIASQANAQPQPGDSTDIIWEVQPEGSIYVTKFSPDNRFVVVDCITNVRMYNISDGTLYKEFVNESTSTYSKDGSILITNAKDTIVIRSTANYEITKKIATHGLDGLGYSTFQIYDMSISPDNRYVACACYRKGIKIYDINTGMLYKTIDNFPFDNKVSPVPSGFTVDFNSDGTKLLFSGDWSILYDLANGSILKMYEGTYPKYSPDNIHFANLFYEYDGPTVHYYLRIYDLSNTTPLFTIPMGTGTFDFCYSPDGIYIVTGSSSYGKYNVEIWDANSGQKKYVYSLPEYNYTSVAWSNDGKNISAINGYLYLLRHNYTSVLDKNLLVTTVYPNPSTGTVKIDFNLQNTELVTFRITDNIGTNINTTNLGLIESGYNSYSHNISALSSGVYFITLQSNSFSQTYKLVKK